MMEVLQVVQETLVALVLQIQVVGVEQVEMMIQVKLVVQV